MTPLFTEGNSEIGQTILLQKQEGEMAEYLSRPCIYCKWLLVERGKVDETCPCQTEKHCIYCFRLADEGGHNEGCPIEVVTPEAMTEWNQGWAKGFADHQNDFQYHSKAYNLGWRAGKDEIERLVELAIDKYRNFPEY